MKIASKQTGGGPEHGEGIPDCDDKVRDDDDVGDVGDVDVDAD